MKLRDASIRLTLDDWIAGSGGLEYRYDHMTYWYGRAIYIVMQTHERVGVSFAVYGGIYMCRSIAVMPAFSNAIRCKGEGWKRKRR